MSSCKKIACCDDGKIYYGRALKNGNMSGKDRADVTNQVLSSMFAHLMSKEDFQRCGISGYTIPVGEGKEVTLCLFDSGEYSLTRRSNT